MSSIYCVSSVIFLSILIFDVFNCSRLALKALTFACASIYAGDCFCLGFPPLVKAGFNLLVISGF